MIWVGIDDTDAPDRGCTTWALTELVRVARSRGFDLIGPPRLVRLNPNVPWRTRGNAALAARFGRGQGAPWTVGEIDGVPVEAWQRSSPLRPQERNELVDALWARVRAVAPRVRRTDPALVASDRPLPSALYWAAVRTIVRIRPLVESLDRWGVDHRHRGALRGLVGASAALAWPARRVTWELIAYRPSSEWGTSRVVDARSVRAAQEAVPELFLCHDPRTRRLLITPHTACPILYGLRGTTPEAPLAARAWVRSEPVDRWMLFRTNQATGDHLVDRSAAELRGYRSGYVTGTVSSPPLTVAGGHVRFDLTDRALVRLPCVSFEPTKTLPTAARRLLPGDRLRVWGSWGRSGRGAAVRLEGFDVLAVTSVGRWVPPTCPRCRGKSRSLGTGRGWRCDRCRRRWPPEAASWEPRERGLRRGTFHPTPSARRHLAPLAR